MRSKGKAMPIASETRATIEVLKDARFHRASLSTTPETEPLVATLEPLEAKLREKYAISQSEEDARLVAYARLTRADIDLDTRTRLMELALLAASGKNREAIAYRAAFPSGMTAMVALRGEAQSRAVTSLVAALRQHTPSVAAEHADALEKLAAAAVEAERVYLDGERRVSNAYVEERLARVALLRQMRVNEGALTTLYPGDKRRVRSFFRPVSRRAASELDAETPQA
jgi:hypothetical protein